MCRINNMLPIYKSTTVVPAGEFCPAPELPTLVPGRPRQWKYIQGRGAMDSNIAIVLPYYERHLALGRRVETLLVYQ